MHLIEFPEQTCVIAKDQPQYMPLPAWRDPDDVQGRIICCWKLSWREVFTLIFTRKIWHSVFTFNQPLQPQLLDLKYPFVKK